MTGMRRTGKDRPLVVFRCDAGTFIGGGHVMRCSALAEVLKRDGWDVAFATSDETLDHAVDLSKEFHTVAGFTTGPEQAASLLASFGRKIDLVVIDHYGIDAAAESAIGEAASRRLVIDDRPGRQHSCEVLLDYSLGRIPNEYASRLEKTCAVLAGEDYALVRSAFRAARLDRPSNRPGFDLRHARILVTTGLADRDNITSVILRGLMEWGFDGTLDVVLGAGAPHIGSVSEQTGQLSGTLHIGIDGRAVAALLSKADLVIGGAGTATMERLCLGRACLAVMIAENQQDNYDSIVSLGAARGLGDWRSFSPGGLAAALSNLTSADVRKMEASALQAVDGLGGARVALSLRPEFAHDGRVVTLKRAKASDALKLYQWQLEPATRAHARKRAVPAFSEHVNWLERRLADPASVFNVIMVGGEPAGVVRLDPLPGGDRRAELSIHVAERFQKNGVALAGLALIARLAQDVEIHAGVLQSNNASMGLFEKAGFTYRGQENGELRYVLVRTATSDASRANGR